MIGRGSVLKNTGILMGMELGIRVMDALVSVVLARYLAPQGFGLLAFALSFASLFSLLPGFGMGTLSMRDVARSPQRLGRYLGNGLYAKIFLSGATLLLMGGVSLLLGFSRFKCWAVLLAGLYMVTETSLRFTLSFFQAMEQSGRVAAVNLAVRAGWVAGSLAVVGMGGGIGQLLGIRFLVTAVGLAAAVALVQARFHRAQWRMEPGFIVRMLKSSVPFVLFRLRGQVFMDIDTVMISMLRGDLMTGWYAAAQKVLRLFTFIPTSFSQAMLPAMSREAERSREGTARTLIRSTRYLLMIGLPIAGVGYVLSDPIVRVMFGPAYQQGAAALKILVWSVPFAFLNGAMVAAVGAVGRERQGMFIMLGCGLFSALSNLIVVPLFGHLGAASTTLMSEILIMGLQLRLLRRELPGLTLTHQLEGLLAAVAGTMGIAALTRGAALAVPLIGSAVAYGGLLMLFRLIGAEDLQVLGDRLRRSRRKEAARVA